jgi:vitamin B12 transporter
MHHRLLPVFLSALAIPAHAVIVQGRITSPLGRPVPGARIQLIDLLTGARSVANAVSGIDGEYEIRTSLSGRFLLLTTSVNYAPQISPDFYGSRTNLIRRDVALDPSSLTQLTTDLPFGLATPLAQLSVFLTQIPADRLVNRAFIPDELPLTPAAFLLESGQTGQPAHVVMQGASSNGNGILFDGQQVQRLGGNFNFGNLAATGLAAISAMPAVEQTSAPNPLESPAAESGLIGLHTSRSTSVRPVLVYSGDAGNLHTWRDEAVATLTHTRTDVFAAFSRFDTSNALPNDRFHSATASLNLGYNISADTSLRMILRNADAAVPSPIPYDLGLTPDTKQADQDLYGTFTFETRTAGKWHNLARYGLVRSREQTFAYSNPVGRPVTLTGANGYTVSGQATPFPLYARQDQATLRDEGAYDTDYVFNRFITALFTFHYQDERALDAVPAVRHTLRRTNLIFAGAMRGEVKHRLFYEGSGNVTHSSLNGFTGSPRLGLTYVPVLGGFRRLKGTSLHLTLASGNREPSLAEQSQSIFAPARSRTLDVFADQNLYRRKLLLHAGYFHNQFSHQSEVISLGAPAAGIGPILSATQAFRTQGLASELHYQPLPRLSVTGGYTYLASLVERSAALPVINSAYPTIPIGVASPLAGQRLFRRPPHSGFFAIQYTGRSLSANLQASLAGRADDSTFNSTLLLPNQNLDHGYTRLDTGFSYAIRRRITLYTQLTNLLNSQHMAPIGYPSTPFTVRSGLKIRFGGE